MVYIYAVFLLCLLGLFSYLYARSKSLAKELLLVFIFSYSTVFISSLYLEIFSPYIYEQAIYSGLNFSTFLFLLVIFLSLFFALCVFSFLCKTFPLREKRGHIISNNYLFFVVGIELILIAHVFISGSPLIELDVSKFNFWSDKALIPAFKVFNWMLYILIFVVGGNSPYFILKKGSLDKFLSLGVLLLALLYYISWGNKFSALMVVFFMYFSPGLLMYRLKYGEPYLSFKKIAVMVVIGFSAVSILVASQYSRYQSRGLTIVEQLLERVFVLQGHVWWGTIEHISNREPHFFQIINESQMVLLGKSSEHYGMLYLMELLAPSSLFYSYLEAGVQFTGGFPAINFSIFGLALGFALSIISWSVFGIFLYYLVKLLLEKSKLRLILSGYLFVSSLSYYLHGTISGFLNWKFFIVVSLLFFLEVVIRCCRVKPLRVGG